MQRGASTAQIRNSLPWKSTSFYQIRHRKRPVTAHEANCASRSQPDRLSMAKAASIATNLCQMMPAPLPVNAAVAFDTMTMLVNMHRRSQCRILWVDGGPSAITVRAGDREQLRTPEYDKRGLGHCAFHATATKIAGVTCLPFLAPDSIRGETWHRPTRVKTRAMAYGCLTMHTDAQMRGVFPWGNAVKSLPKGKVTSASHLLPPNAVPALSCLRSSYRARSGYAGPAASRRHAGFP